MYIIVIVFRVCYLGCERAFFPNPKSLSAFACACVCVCVSVSTFILRVYPIMMLACKMINDSRQMCAALKTKTQIQHDNGMTLTLLHLFRFRFRIECLRFVPLFLGCLLDSFTSNASFATDDFVLCCKSIMLCLSTPIYALAIN